MVNTSHTMLLQLHWYRHLDAWLEKPHLFPTPRAPDPGHFPSSLSPAAGLDESVCTRGWQFPMDSSYLAHAGALGCLGNHCLSPQHADTPQACPLCPPSGNLVLGTHSSPGAYTPGKGGWWRVPVLAHTQGPSSASQPMRHQPWHQQREIAQWRQGPRPHGAWVEMRRWGEVRLQQKDLQWRMVWPLATVSPISRCLGPQGPHSLRWSLPAMGVGSLSTSKLSSLYLSSSPTPVSSPVLQSRRTSIRYPRV